MTDRPNKYPDWATEDYIDPVSGENNVIEPPLEKKQKGWGYRDKGIRNWFNYNGRLINDWTKYLDFMAPQSYPVASLPDATAGRRFIFVEPLVGDAYPAYSDGTVWRTFDGVQII